MTIFMGIVQFINCFFLFYTVYLFLKSFSSAPPFRFKIIVAVLVAAVIQWFVNSLQQPIYNTISTIVLTFLITLFFNQKWLNRILYTGVLSSIPIIVEIIIGFILGVFQRVFTNLLTGTVFFVLFSMLSIIIRLFIILLVIKLFSPSFYQIDLKRFLYLLIIPALSLLAAMYIMLYRNVPEISFSETVAISILCFGFVLANFLVFYVYNSIVREYQLQNEMNALRRLQKEQANYYQHLDETLQLTHQMKHDLKKHLNTIQQLYEHKHYEEAGLYLRQYKDALNEFFPPIALQTNNNTLNLILYDKSKECKQNNVDFRATLHHKDFAELDPLVTTAIFANAMDNAVHAACNTNPGQNRFVRFQSDINTGNLVVVIENSKSNEILEEGNKLLSTKADAESHGLGHNIIRQTVNKLGGYLKYEYAKNTFSLIINIPYQQLK